MRKKVLSILLAVLLIGAVPFTATGCTKKGDISVMLLANSAERVFYERYFKELGEDMGIKIDFIGYSHNDYYSTLKNDINAGTVSDILYIRPSDLRTMVAENVISPIDEYIKDQTEVDFSKIYPIALSSYKYNYSTKKFGEGSTYAVPKDLSVQQLGYNKTIVERNTTAIKAAGLKLPWEMNWETENYTWNQYKTLAALCAVDSKTSPVYGSDVPKVEIIAKSFGGGFLSSDLQNITVNTTAFKDAVKFQAEMIRDGAANYEGATYANFTAGKVAFYGEANSFDIKSMDDMFDDLDMEWDIMPWPVAEGQQPTEWKGLITSAGYAVSKSCSNKQLATDIILTLLSDRTQDRLVRTEKLMLPLYKDIAENSFCSSEFDSVYSPKSRKVYIDVISGKNGFFPAEYSTYDYTWYETSFEGYLESVYASEADKVMAKLKSDAEYDSIQSSMQSLYNDKKNK